jgi:fatty-acyl-CoA synthase
LNDCNPAFLFFSEDFSNTVLFLKVHIEHYIQVISIGREEFSWAESYNHIKRYPSMEPSGFEQPAFEDPHIIIYSSGTTGAPKGAVLSNRKTFYNALNADIFFKLTPNDIVLVTRPLFHSGGLLINSTPALYKGCTIIFKKHFSPQEYLETIEKYGVTISEPAATFLNFVLIECNLDRWKLGTLKSFYTGGERVPISLLRKYHQKNLHLSQLFGMTETSTLTWLPSEYAVDKAGSVGKPVFHGHVEIRNKDGKHIAPGEIGEIMVSGPILMNAYWKSPEQTADVIKNGWLHTGDLATMDEEGFFYIIDRAKDTYISGGENIQPAEIEKLLLTNPRIFDVAVCGVPDEKWGEVGKATIVVTKGQNLTSEEVTNFLRGKIGNYKIPHYIDFATKLPRTASGKIKRFILVEQFKQMTRKE